LKALEFYAKTLGFQKKSEFPVGDSQVRAANFEGL
jgi:hypothetical protein